MADSGYDIKSLSDGLIANGLIVPGPVPGVFGRNAVFEDVLERVNRLITEFAGDEGGEPFQFPPVIDRRILERVDYMDSFPHLVGSVNSFIGNEREARAVSQAVHAGEPWGQMLKPTDLVLAPAACYPVYPSITGELPEGGRLISTTGWVFRHEPSPEPTRMQSFRVRELIRAASPEDCVAWRDLWLERGIELLTALRLPLRSDVASDPFFGRVGKVLQDGQKAQRLKFEILVPVISESEPTAVCSFNYHQDHFSQVFDIRAAGGGVAHTACLGFGLERVVMALFRTHGFRPDTWPDAVRDRLWR